MKFSIKDFLSKCDQIRSFLRIWSHFLKKSLMENFVVLYSLYEGSLNFVLTLFAFSSQNSWIILDWYFRVVITAWKLFKYAFFFWSVISCIWTEYRDIRTEKTLYLDTFYEVCFFCLINVDVVRKNCVHLILICTIFLLHVDFKILTLKSVLTPTNCNKKDNTILNTPNLKSGTYRIN